MKKVKQDIAGLILQVQQQLTFLDKKIDTLIGQPLPRPVEARPAPRQENSYRERVLHKAICADCKKECEVPFRPREDRPVYCKECFSKRKAGGPGGSFKGSGYNRPREAAPAQPIHISKPHGGDKKKVVEKKKFYEKIKPGSKKRKR